MKTLKKWRQSEKCLNDYITKPSLIDQDLFDYLGEVVIPQYWSENYIQSGEPMYTDKYDITYFMTCSKIGDEYFYLGLLPEFKRKP